MPDRLRAVLRAATRPTPHGTGRGEGLPVPA
jgi:hypothetical protein